MFHLFKRQTPAQRLQVIDRKLPGLIAREALLIEMINSLKDIPRTMFDESLNLRQFIAEMKHEQAQLKQEQSE